MKFENMKTEESRRVQELQYLRSKIKKLKTVIANYMSSEGCSCCQDTEAHKKHEEELAKLLGVEKYEDGSGYDFSKYRSK